MSTGIKHWMYSQDGRRIPMTFVDRSGNQQFVGYLSKQDRFVPDYKTMKLHKRIVYNLFKLLDKASWKLGILPQVFSIECKIKQQFRQIKTMKVKRK